MRSATVTRSAHPATPPVPGVRIRLTRRGRVAAVVVALAAVVAAGLGGVGVATAQAGGPGQAVAVAEHTVAPGETLWRIAQEATVAGEDVRDTVAELRRINGLQGSVLMAGQQILVPER